MLYECFLFLCDVFEGWYVVFEVYGVFGVFFFFGVEIFLFGCVKLCFEWIFLCFGCVLVMEERVCYVRFFCVVICGWGDFEGVLVWKVDYWGECDLFVFCGEGVVYFVYLVVLIDDVVMWMFWFGDYVIGGLCFVKLEVFGWVDYKVYCFYVVWFFCYVKFYLGVVKWI